MAQRWSSSRVGSGIRDSAGHIQSCSVKLHLTLVKHHILSSIRLINLRYWPQGYLSQYICSGAINLKSLIQSKSIFTLMVYDWIDSSLSTR